MVEKIRLKKVLLKDFSCVYKRMRRDIELRKFILQESVLKKIEIEKKCHKTKLNDFNSIFRVYIYATLLHYYKL